MKTTLLGSFKNEHQEQFKVQKLENNFPYRQTFYFITGDETDWEPTPLFNPNFILTGPELKEIIKILNKEL